MTDREIKLGALLNEAICLLEVEARDHNQNHFLPVEKRKNIAQILGSFCLKARNGLYGSNRRVA
jgi:hypothetical protein